MGGGISHFRKTTVVDKPQIAAPSDAPEEAASPRVVYITPLPIESPAKRALISQMSLNIMISPRRELALLSSVPFTPLGKEASVYCYYCPLCMEFFESILKTKCCGNYICLKCSIEYLNAKGFVAESVKEIIGNNLLKSVNCPHCVTLGFNPQLVEKNDSIRDYSREVTGDAIPKDGSHSPNNVYTPLKVGDTFEELKRKMIPFAVMRAVSTLNEQGIATITREPDIVSTEPDKPPKSLNSIFDSVAERPDARSPAESSLQDYVIDTIAPDNLIVACMRNREVSNSNNTNYNDDRLPTEENSPEPAAQNSPENIGIQINVEILAKNPDELSDVLKSFLTEDSSLKSCCRFIASQMMKKIIDNVVIENGK